MACTPGKVRELAHGLYPYEQVVQERNPRQGLRSPSKKRHKKGQGRGDELGQHIGKGPSRRDRRFKKNGGQSIGRSRGGWTTKIHMVAADARTALTFSLSPGNAHDAPEGRALMGSVPAECKGAYLIMDKAYEGDETRQLALDLGFEPVVPPKGNRLEPWEYNREMYKRRNEVERLFRRLKGFRRIFSRFDKLDVMFTAFIYIALIFDVISVNTP